MILSLLISLFLTLVIEITVSFIIGIRDKEDLKVVFWVNVLTNPIVVYIANLIILLNNKTLYNVTVIIMEILAIIVEAVLYKKCLNYKKKSPLIISSINNIISYSLGVIIGLLL